MVYAIPSREKALLSFDLPRIQFSTGLGKTNMAQVLVPS